MSGSTAFLELQGVSKSYGDAAVLKPTDLTVLQGEFLTILGPSGSGKTTILRLIGGFTTPSSGRVCLGGEDLSRTPIHRRPFNTVFQDYALFPHMRVRQNVGYGLRVRGVPRAEVARRVAEVLAIVELSDKADRFPADLSGGQRQRVALARAIICQPRLVLLDEPLAALDAELRRAMQTFLKDLQQRIATTFIFVTHDQDEAMAISDRIVVMDHGGIEQLGSPREIYDHPKSRFVAGFFGESNILPADLRGRCADPQARWIAIRPERVKVSRPAGAAGALRGRVRRVTFLGPDTELSVSVSGQEADVKARIPTASLPDWVGVGADVELGWSDGDASCLRT